MPLTVLGVQMMVRQKIFELRENSRKFSFAPCPYYPIYKSFALSFCLLAVSARGRKKSECPVYSTPLVYHVLPLSLKKQILSDISKHSYHMGFEEEKNLKNQKSYRYQHKTVGYFATCSGGKDLGDAIILIGHFFFQQLFYSQLI